MFSTRISAPILIGFLIQPPVLAENDYVPFDMPYVGASFGRGAITECSKLSGELVLIPGLENVSDTTTIENVGGDALQERLPRTRIRNCGHDKAHKIYGGIDFNLTFVPMLLGIETGYIDMGRNSMSGSVHGTFYTPLGTPRLNPAGNPVTYEYPMRDGLSEATSIFYGLRFGARILDDHLLLFGKAGFHNWEHQYSFLLDAGMPNPTGLTPEQVAALPALPNPGNIRYRRADHEKGRDIFYGLGVQYNFPQKNGNVIGLRADWDRYVIKSELLETDRDVYSVGVLYGFDIYSK